MVIERVELRNTEDGHHKAYILTLEKDGETFIVRARWGRIEATENGGGQELVKGQFDHERSARSLVSKLIQRKKERGYVEHSTQSFSEDRPTLKSASMQGSGSSPVKRRGVIWSGTDIAHSPESFAEALRAELEEDRRERS